MNAVRASGICSMSLLSIAFQPRIDEPSKPRPSVKVPSSNSWSGWVLCCHCPTKSTNFRSTSFTPSLLAKARTSLGDRSLCMFTSLAFCRSDRVFAAIARADAHRFDHRQYEYLPVADAARVRSGLNRSDHLGDEVVGGDDLEFDLGQEVHDVLRAPVELRVALLPAEALHLRDGDALKADRVQRFLHLIELEGLDDGFDLLHPTRPLRPGERSNGYTTVRFRPEPRGERRGTRLHRACTPGCSGSVQSRIARSPSRRRTRR